MAKSLDQASASSSSASSDDYEEQIEEVLHTNGRPFVTEFEGWTSSPDGKKRDSITVKQHAAQLLKLLTVFRLPDDVKSLLDVKFIQSVFLNVYVKDKEFQPGTIKLYLTSLCHWYTFLLLHRPDGEEFHVEKSTREKIQMWPKLYKKEACTCQLEKQEDLSHSHSREYLLL